MRAIEIDEGVVTVLTEAGAVPLSEVSPLEAQQAGQLYAAVVDMPPLTAEQRVVLRKAERQAIVDAITVTISTGKVFDGNEEAQSRMSRAIQAAQIASIPETTWVLANNTPTVVTLAEMCEALVLSMQAMGVVWSAPYED